MRFIVFEGLDAAGKSTLIHKVDSQLIQLGLKTQQLRDPGSTELGESLRNIILTTQSEPPVSRAETLLYQAARVQMVEKKIKPALKTGWVLCDRFYSSTIAFQVFARGLKMEDVVSLNDFVAHDCQPDLFIYLDITVDESLKRKEKRSLETGVEQDRMEKENREFQEKVRKGYLHQAKETPERWLVLDATKTPDELLKEVMEELGRRQWLS